MKESSHSSVSIVIKKLQNLLKPLCNCSSKEQCKQECFEIHIRTQANILVTDISKSDLEIYKAELSISNAA